MAISLNCPKCGKRFDLKDEMAGKKGRCACGTVFVIPAAPPPVVAQPPAQQPVAADPLMQQPMAADPLMQQPMAQPAYQQQPMAQPAYQQQPMAGNWNTGFAGGYGRTSGGSQTLLFVGHQLAFWPRIGILVGILMLLISFIMIASDPFELASTAETIANIAGYGLAIAGAVSLVGLGFFLNLPRQTGTWGFALAALVVCIIGDSLGTIMILAEIRSSAFLIITILAYYAGGVMTCVMLRSLAGYYRRDDAEGLAMGGIIMNAVSAGFFILVYVLVTNRFFMGDPDNIDDAMSMASFARWMLIISSVLFAIMWAAAVGLEMATLGKIRDSIRRS